MMTKQEEEDDNRFSSSPLERVICEEAQELGRRRIQTVGFAHSVMQSTFKSAGELENAQTAFVLMQWEEEHKGKEDSIFTEW